MLTVSDYGCDIHLSPLSLRGPDDVIDWHRQLPPPFTATIITGGTKIKAVSTSGSGNKFKRVCGESVLSVLSLREIEEVGVCRGKSSKVRRQKSAWVCVRVQVRGSAGVHGQ